MKTRYALLLIALLPLASCKNDTPAPVGEADIAAAATPVAKQATAEDPTVKVKGDAEAKAAAESAAKAPPPVAGTDYAVIANGQPFDTTDGRIEVAEIFGYVCPFCAGVEPTVRAMKAKFPADVHMIYIPAAFGSMWDTYAKAYYTAEAMGLVDKTHDALFRAIHVDKTLKGERGHDTPEDIAAFYAGYGADPKQFVSSMASFAIAAKVNRSRQWVTAAFGDDRASTPTFIINGKYRVKGKTIDDMFRVINQLVAAERAKPAAAAQSAPSKAPTPAPVAH
jgi:thiol:disulfide interchange protein DsbA